MRILITGGAGFIGSAFVKPFMMGINIDALTYASSLDNLVSISRVIITILSIFREIDQVLEKFQPDSIIHLAAESHVDICISNFITTINGTYNLKLKKL